MPDTHQQLLDLFDPSVEEERCGLIGSDGVIYPVTNTHAEPTNGFRMNPSELLDLTEAYEIVATWHTHPTGDSLLSQEDYAGFLQWPDLTHYIISPEGVSEYVVEDSLVLKL